MTLPVRKTDPATSFLAAARRPKGRSIDRMRALLLHGANSEGLTDFELGDLMKRQQTSAGKRRGELRDLGFISDSYKRRAAPSGSLAIVWRITLTGLLEARRLLEEYHGKDA